MSWKLSKRLLKLSGGAWQLKQRHRMKPVTWLRPRTKQFRPSRTKLKARIWMHSAKPTSAKQQRGHAVAETQQAQQQVSNARIQAMQLEREKDAAAAQTQVQQKQLQRQMRQVTKAREDRD